MNKIAIGFLMSLLLFCSGSSEIWASELTFVSIIPSSSAPNTAVNFTINFTNATAIPPQGKIIITPPPGYFNIESGFDYTDADLSVSNIDKNLAASSGNGSGSNVGLSVVTGTSGSFTFSLNDTDGISVGSAIVIKLGTNASLGSAGDKQITTPSVGSYSFSIMTQNSSSAQLDNKSPMIVILNPVGVSGSLASGQVVSPSFSPPSSSFDTNISVSISTSTSGADIYYTLDGSVPTISSTLYSGSFSLSDTTTVKAVAVKSGFTNSDVVSATFTKNISSGGGGGGSGGANNNSPESPVAIPVKPVPPQVDNCSDKKADLNCDKRVNLIDLSILLYNWGKPKNNQRADINKDGTVNLIDFSILLYWWTD